MKNIVALLSCVGLLIYGEAALAIDRFVSSKAGDDLNGLNDCLEKARPCKTIAQAINRASSGDTIKVLPGTPYLECGLIVQDKLLKIISDGGRAVIEPDAALDDAPDPQKICKGRGGEGEGFVFKIAGQKAKGSSLEGFIIRARIKKTRGVAVLIVENTSSVLIKDNQIVVKKEGDDTEAGVGLLILDSSFNEIVNNEIQGAKEPKNEQGILLRQTGTVLVEGNLFKNNRIFNHGESGILILDVIASPTRPNLFLGNRLENNGGAGVVALNSAGLQFGSDRFEEKNQIVNNQGAGLDFRSPCGGEEKPCTGIKVQQNTLSQNSVGISFSTTVAGGDAHFQQVYLSNNTIQDNKGDGLSFGPGVYQEITVASNILQHNTGGGIVLEELKSSSHLELSRNLVRLQKGSGISMKVSGQVELEVQDNIVTDNDAMGIVIQLLQGSKRFLMISGNVASRNKDKGLSISGSVSDDSESVISNNTAEDNGTGFHLQGDNYKLSKNVIRRNLVGLKLESGSKNSVEDNVITNNHCTGLEISGGRDNTILRNTFLFNGLSCPADKRDPAEGNAAGILLTEGGDNQVFSFNTIEGNLNGISLLALDGAREGNKFACNAITRNTRGIQVLPAKAQEPIPDRFHRNNIERNAEFGLRNFAATPVNVKENWWGDTSGPKHETNPDGKGDRILGPTDFSNWLRQPIDINRCP